MNSTYLSFRGEKSHPYYPRVFFLLKNFAYYYGFKITEEAGFPEIIWTSHPPPASNNHLCWIQALPVKFQDQITWKKNSKSWQLPTHPFHDQSLHDFQITSGFENSPNTSHLQNTEVVHSQKIKGEGLNYSLQKNHHIYIFLDILAYCTDILWKKQDFLPDYLDSSREALCHEFDRNHLLHRFPIVDGWIDWVFQNLRWGYPGKVGKCPQNSSFFLSHDIDVVKKWTLRHCAKKTPSILMGLFTNTSKSTEDLKEWWQALHRQDPYDQIQNLARIDGKYKSTFFFLGRERDHLAKRYSVTSATIHSRIQHLLKNQFSIGLHGVRGPIFGVQELSKEKLRVELTVGKTIHIHRSHFLKWEPLKTIQYLLENQIYLDATMGYNNTPGFRCGTVRPFFWYDFEQDTPTQLLEIPLITADFQICRNASIQPKDWMSEWKYYFEQSRFPGSVFSHLHHNHYFHDRDFPGHTQWYLEILDFVKNNQIPAFQPNRFYLEFSKDLNFDSITHLDTEN